MYPMHDPHGVQATFAWVRSAPASPANVPSLTCSPPPRTTKRRGAAVAAPDECIPRKRTATAVTPSRYAMAGGSAAGPTNGGESGAARS